MANKAKDTKKKVSKKKKEISSLGILKEERQSQLDRELELLNDYDNCCNDGFDDFGYSADFGPGFEIKEKKSMFNKIANSKYTNALIQFFGVFGLLNFVAQWMVTGVIIILSQFIDCGYAPDTCLNILLFFSNFQSVMTGGFFVAGCYKAYKTFKNN